MKQRKILIVEDDLSLSRLLQTVFEEMGYKIYVADNGATALEIYVRYNPEIILLDIDLPEKNGWEVMTLIRKENKLVPILIMTAHKTKESDSLKSYDLGATSYIRKPFFVKEVAASISSLFDLAYGYVEIISIGNYQLNMSSFCLQTNAKEYQLKEREARTLYLLGKNKNQIVKTEYILEQIWHCNSPNNLQMLRNSIVELRRILQNENEMKIETIHKKGYVMY